MVQQEVVITLRGTAKLKEMLLSLSKLKGVPMNSIAAELIRKEHNRVMNLCTCETASAFPKLGRNVDCPLHGWGKVQVDGEPPNYVPPRPIGVL